MGLFLLRVITACLVGYAGYGLLYGLTGSRLLVANHVAGAALAIASLMLAAGLYTVVAAMCAGMILLGWTRVASTSSVVLTLTTLGLTVVTALLGAGAYSVDARLSGWKRFEIGSRRKRVNL